MPQGIEVGNRFAHGKSGLVQVQLALEQHRQQLGRAARCARAGLQQVIQAFSVVFLQLFNAQLGPLERSPMRGQHQAVVGDARHAFNRVQKPLQGIAVGLLRIHAHIR